MAQLIVDEVMLREPNLLVPGKEPVGPVKIDWSNPLTDKLRGAYYILQEGQLRNFVNNEFNAVTFKNTGKYDRDKVGLHLTGTTSAQIINYEANIGLTDSDFPDDNATLIELLITTTGNQGYHNFRGDSQVTHYTYANTHYTSNFRANRISGAHTAGIIDKLHYHATVQDFTNDSYNVYTTLQSNKVENSIISTTSGAAWSFATTTRLGANPVSYTHLTLPTTPYV